MSSFSADVKSELAREFGDFCCQLAEIISLIRMNGSIVIGGNKALGISFTSENAAVTRKVLTMLKRNFNITAAVMVSRGRRLKKSNTYSIKVAPSPLVNELLAALGFANATVTFAKDKGLLRKACCRRAYLRGAFLGGGSVNKPEGDYHLELVTGNEDFAKSLVRVMKTFKLTAKLTERKEDTIIYLKGGDAITIFLQVIGAHNALLAFENVRVVKDMRNQVNRLVNCETANLQKTVNAAVRQVDYIKLLSEALGLENLPQSLREAAEIRLKFPEATLQELVDITGGVVTKSGMNHRLRKLVEIAQQVENGGNKEQNV